MATAALVGTADGIVQLATFIKVSGAFVRLNDILLSNLTATPYLGIIPGYFRLIE
jgi:hypothetical protein